jgi:hypothetical protein
VRAGADVDDDADLAVARTDETEARREQGEDRAADVEAAAALMKVQTVAMVAVCGFGGGVVVSGPGNRAKGRR